MLARLFTDKDIALKEDVDQLLNGSIYKGAYDATGTGTPALPTGTDVLGDFYRVTTPNALSGYNTGDILVYNGTDYDHVAEQQATQSDIKNSALRMYDIYVKAAYTGAVSDGSVLYPYSNLETAVASANDGDQIYIEGTCELSGEITLPNKSLFFYGADDAVVKFTSYDAANANLMRFTGTDNTKEFKFNNITFMNAGGYALYIQKTAKVEIDDCLFTNNGWNGQALNTVLPSTTTALLGYDSASADLQAFYAGTNASNGGAMRIEEATQLLITGNTVTKNLRGIRVSDCGVGGGGVISRNQSMQNIESGIYLSVGALGGCQNITVTINASTYNANNGLLIIGGLNNKFSQNEVNGNWNAGFCAWGAGNTTLRDCGLYDNNRSALNGIGNTGDAKASIQINEAYNLLGTAISLNPAARFIAEILDTQVHYTGLGSNTEKIGFLISSAVGALADNPKNIIKVDDVGFIGQDYAIDLSEVDVTNLRLSLGDNSYQTITFGAVKAPLAGNYNELPFSNHVMEVPAVDVEVDTLKHMVSLHEGVDGNVINTYQANELVSVINGTTIDILQANSDKIQLKGLTHGNIYINGVVAGNSLNSANDSLNAAFNMDLIEYKEFLVSEVGINGDESSGGSLPAIANNWYISYGSLSGTQIPTATIGNNYRNYNPFYNGEALEKGHEFIWTKDVGEDFAIGIWGAAEAVQNGTDAIEAANWSTSFRWINSTNRWSGADSSGVTIERNGSVDEQYDMINGTLALRFGQDNFLYLFEVVSGGYQLIGKSTSTIAGSSVLVQLAGHNGVTFPVMTERTETWEIAHDLDQSEAGEWSNGIEQSTILRSRMSINPGEKVTMDINWQGRGERFGISYTGADNGVAAAQDTIGSALFYNVQEVIKELGATESIWDWNTDATNSYDPNGDQSDVGYTKGNGTPLGLISLRYKSDNTLELWHETDNVRIATKVAPLDGTAFNVYFGANSDNQTADKIPTLIKYNLTADDAVGSNEITGWYYIESPDGEFYYPLFATEAEANYIDTLEGGSGTSHTHTFADDTYNTGANTWYMNDTTSVHAGSAAPLGGIYGNSINVVWNEIPTGDDSNYLPTFNDITYNVQEGSAINIQYKAAGMTDTFNVTNVPAGYADNGFAIIGTAEDITNGYGQSVTHTINVTKANNFGSVQGTITINVLANLAGNEFTIVEESNGIRFTQDEGGSTLDFNTVTFNAGSTYKFYLDGPTVESNDTLMVVDANGNAYTTGVTLNGTPGSAGAYLEFVVPADVPPVSLVWTDGDGAATVTVPMTVAGSTYSVSVTGITLEGPSANQTGTNIFDAAGQHGWLSIDEPLGAGQRLVLSGTFLADLADAMGDQNMVMIGLKDGAWANTIGNAIPTGFEGDMILTIYRISSTNFQMYGYNVATGTITTKVIGTHLYNSSQFLNYNAFIEVTSSGNNIRVGHALTNTHDATTETYADWTSTAKVESGDQGFGITELDVMVKGLPLSVDAGTTDASDIDWTALSEIAVPAAPTMVTPWTKAIDFSGGNEHLLKVNIWTGSNALLMDSISQVLAGPSTVGNTTNASNARPWATAIVFQSKNNTNNQHIWNSGEGAASGADNIYLRVTGANGDLYFGWGRQGSVNECLIGNIGGSANSTHWWGIYVGYNGTRLSGSNATAANLAAAFDIRLMGSNDAPSAWAGLYDVGTEADWTAGSTGGRMDRAFTGYFTIGGRGSNRNFHGKVASMVVTTLRLGVAMPTDAEIRLMITDPKKWEDDYRVGQTVRRSQGTSNVTYANSSVYNGHGGTQIWLMGDGTLDSYANGIRNDVYPADQNYGKLQLNSMQSNDIQNVTIPSLP